MLQPTILQKLRDVWKYEIFPRTVMGAIHSLSPQTSVGYVATQSAKDRWDVHACYAVYMTNGKTATLQTMIDRVWGDEENVRSVMADRYNRLTEDEATRLSRRIFISNHLSYGIR